MSPTHTIEEQASRLADHLYRQEYAPRGAAPPRFELYHKDYKIKLISYSGSLYHIKQPFVRWPQYANDLIALVTICLNRQTPIYIHGEYEYRARLPGINQEFDKIRDLLGEVGEYVIGSSAVGLAARLRQGRGI